MTENELKSGDYIRRVVAGHTSEGEPWQRVYATTDPVQADHFDLLIKAQGKAPLRRSDLNEIIRNNFPAFVLISDQVGNDITPVEKLPKTLPLGEGIYDEENNLQLLQRAVLQRLDEWEEAQTRSGNEITSNIPTYIGAALKGDEGLIAAGIGGTIVAGIIIWRGHQQRNKLVDTLKIWVEYKNELKINSPKARKDLNVRMNESGLLFSGIEEQDLSRFKDGELDQLCTDLSKKHGLWYDKITLPERIKNLRLPDADTRLQIGFWLHNDSITDTFRVATGYASIMWDYSLGQIKDIWRNPRSPDTWKRIGIGLADTPLLTYDIAKHFIDSARRQRAEAQHIDQKDGSLTTNDPETLQQIRIEHVEAIRDEVDDHLITELDSTQEDSKHERRDGMWMIGAQAGETLFYAGHIHSAATSGYNLVQHHILGKPPETTPETWIDNDETAFGLSLVSMALASGAYAHIGREISLIKKSLRSRRAQVFGDLYPKIAAQYSERVNSSQETMPSTEPS